MKLLYIIVKRRGPILKGFFPLGIWKFMVVKEAWYREFTWCSNYTVIVGKPWLCCYPAVLTWSAA